MKIQKMLENQLLALGKEIGSAQIKESVEKIWRDMRKNKKEEVQEEEEKGTSILKPTQKALKEKDVRIP